MVQCVLLWIEGLGFRLNDKSVGFVAQGLWLWIKGLGFRVNSLGCRVRVRV